MTKFNTIIVVGRLTRDPELRYTQSGKVVVTLGLAYNDAFDKNDEVNFIDVTVWGKLAENIKKYTQKGSEVLISGRLKQERWEDRNTGTQRSKHIIIADKIQFISKSKGISNTTGVNEKNLGGRTEEYNEYGEPMGEPPF